MPRRSCSCLAFRIAPCCCARATWGSRRRRHTTSKCGCRASRSIARFHRARTAKRSRHGARTSVIGPDGTGEGGVRPHVEWIRARGRAHVDCDSRELSAGGRVRGDPRGLRPFMGGREVSNQAVDKFSAGRARARGRFSAVLVVQSSDFVAGCDNDETTACGGMAEWLMAAVLKTAVPERVSGVRIPLPPPRTEGSIPERRVTVHSSPQRHG